MRVPLLYEISHLYAIYLVTLVHNCLYPPSSTAALLSALLRAIVSSCSIPKIISRLKLSSWKEPARPRIYYSNIAGQYKQLQNPLPLRPGLRNNRNFSVWVQSGNTGFSAFHFFLMFACYISPCFFSSFFRLELWSLQPIELISIQMSATE